MFYKLVEDLKKIPEIEAISLGGSRATGNNDDKSDYDIYLYCNGPISIDLRRNILSKYSKYMEIGNSFWELEDNGTFNDGIDYDILYRNLDDFINGIENVVIKHNSSNGYTTCMWHNLLTCKVVYDKTGRLTNAKNMYNIPYPKELKESIINRNIRLIHNNLHSYNLQIEKALNRNDIISISHRSAAFFESYFDIIFAVNELTHPGEKRLVNLCLKTCKVLPNNFSENIKLYFNFLYQNYDKAKEILNEIINELECILK